MPYHIEVNCPTCGSKIKLLPDGGMTDPSGTGHTHSIPKQDYDLLDEFISEISISSKASGKSKED